MRTSPTSPARRRLVRSLRLTLTRLHLRERSLHSANAHARSSKKDRPKVIQMADQRRDNDRRRRRLHVRLVRPRRYGCPFFKCKRTHDYGRTIARKRPVWSINTQAPALGDHLLSVSLLLHCSRFDILLCHRFLVPVYGRRALLSFAAFVLSCTLAMCVCNAFTDIFMALNL